MTLALGLSCTIWSLLLVWAFPGFAIYLALLGAAFTELAR